jgi:hypothetical protein
MLNKWINGTSIAPSEQDLYQSLTTESIQMKGMDVRYLVRTMENRDFLFGESTVSSFSDYFVVEMYLAHIENFNGDGALFAQFGMEMKDRATFEVSIPRFKDEARAYELDRPREGDLIYMPMDEALYEITRVKQDPQFRKLGKNYRYILVCELFSYSYEDMPEDGPEQDIVNVLVNDSDGISEALGLSPNNLNNENEEIKAKGNDVISPFNEDTVFGGDQ